MSAGLAVALRKVLAYISAGSKPNVAVPDVHRTGDGSVHVDISEPRLHATPDWAAHHHVSEGASHIALHPAVHRNVAEHSVDLIPHLVARNLDIPHGPALQRLRRSRTGEYESAYRQKPQNKRPRRR